MKNIKEIIATMHDRVGRFYAPVRSLREMHKPKVKTPWRPCTNIMLDVDESANRSLTAEYNIRSVPTLIIFANGEQRWRQSGVTSSAKLAKLLTEYGEKAIAK